MCGLKGSWRALLRARRGEAGELMLLGYRVMQRAMRARSKAYSARSVFSRNPWRLRPAHCVYYNDGMNTHDLRRYAPATARNRDAILEVLQPELKPGDRVLEVGSGTGEHIVHFAQSLPQVHWQPSEADASQ